MVIPVLQPIAMKEIKSPFVIAAFFALKARWKQSPKP